MHRWRGEVDAICIGIGTALADDPLLTARGGGRHPPADPGRVRLGGEAAARQQAGADRAGGAARGGRVARRRTAVARKRCARPAPRGRGRRAAPSRSAWSTRSTSSAALGIQSMLLEGGPRLAGSFLDAGEIDEMRLFVAPIAVGGRAARAPFEGEGSDSIADAQQALARRSSRVDEDVLIQARLQGVVATAPLFTGLVQELGRRRRGRAAATAAARVCGSGRLCRRAIRRRFGARQRRLPHGDGAGAPEFGADLSAETLSRSSLGGARRRATA